MQYFIAFADFLMRLCQTVLPIALRLKPIFAIKMILKLFVVDLFFYARIHSGNDISLNLSRQHKVNKLYFDPRAPDTRIISTYLLFHKIFFRNKENNFSGFFCRCVQC